MATRYSTSKISSIEEIYSGTGLTMGFRGEALFSMACVSDRLVVATRTAEEEMATKLSFGRDGQLVMPDGSSCSSTTTTTTDQGGTMMIGEPISRKVGTTVAVVRPFGSLPARRADLTRRIKAERTKIFKLIEAYGIFHVGVCMNLIDIGGNSREDTALATSSSSRTIQETASSVLGPTFVKGMGTIDISLDPILQRIYGENRHNWGIKGLLSKEPNGTTTAGFNTSANNIRMVQYYSINGRIVELPKVTALLKRLWTTFGGKKKPSALLALTLPNDAFDINLSPDKQTVLLTQEQELMGLIEDYVTQLWSSQGSAVFAVNSTSTRKQQQQQHDGVKETNDSSRGRTGLLEVRNDDDDDDVGLRQMHKRRFAFVHDLSKAKMQHDLAGRRMFNGDGDDDNNYENDDHRHQNSIAQNQTRPNDDHEHPTTKKARVSLDSSGKVDDISSSTSLPCDVQDHHNHYPPVETSETSPRISDKERIQWNEIQAKFRRTEDRSDDECDVDDDNDDDEVPLTLTTLSDVIDTKDSPPSVVSPVSPDDVNAAGQLSLRCQSESVSSHNTRSETKFGAVHRREDNNGVNDEGNEGTTETTKPATTATFTRKSMLQQFAFQPAGSSIQITDNRKRITRSNGNRPPQGITVVPSNERISSEKPREEVAKTVASSPSDVECNESYGRPTRSTTKTPLNDDVPDKQSKKASSPIHSALENNDMKTMTQNGIPNITETQTLSKESTVLTSTHQQNECAEKGRPGSGTEETAPQIVWDSFGSTDQVCYSARLERLQMRKRKRSIDKVRRIVSLSSTTSVDPEPMTDHSIKTMNGKTNGSSDVKDDEAVVARRVESDDDGCDEFAPPTSTSASFIRMSKATFRDGMQVIGQFNLGFILVKCAKNHLWILDQHACDERYNFEQLCKNTKIHEQPLFKPLPLELSPIEEACVLDHMDIFQANGFRFAFDTDAPIRHRLSLTALPHSGAQEGRRAVQFGPSDVSALCSILIEGSSYDPGAGGTGTDGSGKYGNNAVRRHASALSSSSSQSHNGEGNLNHGAGTHADRILARLPKAIAMFASRACRSSIMIGTALSQREMEGVVQKLADVDQPFTCAHGRPTMRHVGNLLPLLWTDERRAAEHIAGPTVTMTPMTQPEEADA